MAGPIGIPALIDLTASSRNSGARAPRALPPSLIWPGNFNRPGSVPKTRNQEQRFEEIEAKKNNEGSILSRGFLSAAKITAIMALRT